MRFPRTIFTKNTIQQQMPVIAGELREVYSEFMEPKVDYDKVAVEILDIIHAAETALEILREQKGIDVEAAQREVIRKNEARFYYEWQKETA